MKKNISINLYGSLYNIDEDAYELLEKYLQSMQTYFAKREGGEEIANDIECRVAELLAEKKEAGMEAVTIKDVQDIIGRIGNPEQMDDEGGSAAPDADQGSTPPPPPLGEDRSSRKLYRDTEDRMLGGVIAGLTHYFGGNDALPWRIIFVILCLMSWSGLAIVYVILWAVLPEARTAEERLRMYGRPVNTKTLNEEIMRGVDKTRNFISSPETKNTARGCLSTLLDVLVFCLKGFCILLLGGLMLAAAICTIVLFAAIIFGSAEMGEVSLGDDSLAAFFTHAPGLRWWLIALAVSGTTVIVMPLYALIRSIMRRTDAPAPSAAMRTTGIVTWLLALAIAIASGIASFDLFEKAHATIETERHATDLVENTRDGHYLTAESWDYLDNMGWHIVQLEGAEPDITSWEEDFLQGHDIHTTCLGLKEEEASVPMRYQIERKLLATPGRYRVVGLLRTDGQGNAFYAKSGDNLLAKSDILPAPVDSASANLRAFESLWGKPIPQESIEEMREEGWQVACFDFAVTVQDTLRYGFTNLPELNSNPWTARKFKASYVKIERVTETPDNH